MCVYLTAAKTGLNYQSPEAFIGCLFDSTKTIPYEIAILITKRHDITYCAHSYKRYAFLQCRLEFLAGELLIIVLHHLECHLCATNLLKGILARCNMWVDYRQSVRVNLVVIVIQGREVMVCYHNIYTKGISYIHRVGSSYSVVACYY